MKIKKGRILLLLAGLIIISSGLNTEQLAGGRPYVFSLEEAGVDLSRPLLLIFFNVSCHVCWDDLFTWRNFISVRRIPVQVVGVTRDPEEAVTAFVRKYSVSLPVVLDRQGILYRKYKVRMEPFRLVREGERVIYQDNLMEPFNQRNDQLEQCLLGIH